MVFLLLSSQKCLQLFIDSRVYTISMKHIFTKRIFYLSLPFIILAIISAWAVTNYPETFKYFAIIWISLVSMVYIVPIALAGYAIGRRIPFKEISGKENPRLGLAGIIWSLALIGLMVPDIIAWFNKRNGSGDLPFLAMPFTYLLFYGLGTLVRLIHK